MNLKKDALRLHAKAKGKFAIRSKVPVSNKWELSLAYSPGVAEPCKVIAQNPEESFRYTNRGNMVAVVSDGTAVLGLGNIGPEAALPVMEGKAILFKSFADIDAIPLCLATTDVDEVVETVVRLTPTFGGINLEDISGPRCFEIERKLKERLEIPVFHDDQHGTAVVCAAGLFNGLKLAGIALEDAKIVINGAGAAGYSIAMLLWHAGARRIRVCDTKGILEPGHCAGNSYQEELARLTNPQGEQGDLQQALKGANVFIGVSVGNIVTREMVGSMAANPIIFSMANPVPEIMPEEALAAGAFVVGTGRSDYPNQINNLLGFPGIFRGALDVRARQITEGMKIAAAHAIAGLVEPKDLNREYIIPNPFDRRVVPAVACAVAKAAMEEGVAKVKLNIAEYKELLERRLSLND